MLSKAKSYVTKKSLVLFLFFFSSLSVSHILQHNMEFYISYKHYQQNLLVTEKNCSNNQSVLRTPVNPFFKNLGTSLSFQNLLQTGSQGLFYQICQVISSSYLQNKHKKIFNLIPRTEILELFTSLNNQIKQHKNLQSDFT